MSRDVTYVLANNAGRFLASIYFARQTYKPVVVSVSSVTDSLRLTFEQAHCIEVLLDSTSCGDWFVIKESNKEAH